MFVMFAMTSWLGIDPAVKKVVQKFVQLRLQKPTAAPTGSAEAPCPADTRVELEEN